MTQTFTHHDLLSYLYGELDPTLQRELEVALLVDTNLAEHFDELCFAQKKLDEAMPSPRETVLEKIRGYARNEVY